MNRLKKWNLLVLTALGAAFIGSSAAEAGRPVYRCAPRTYWRPAQVAPGQSYYVQDAQGTYRRYSVEPGVDGTEAVIPSQSVIPATPAPAARSTPSTNRHRDIEMRRQRPGQPFGRR